MRDSNLSITASSPTQQQPEGERYGFSLAPPPVSDSKLMGHLLTRGIGGRGRALQLAAVGRVGPNEAERVAGVSERARARAGVEIPGSCFLTCSDERRTYKGNETTEQRPRPAAHRPPTTARTTCSSPRPGTCCLPPPPRATLTHQVHVRTDVPVRTLSVLQHIQVRALDVHDHAHFQMKKALTHDAANCRTAKHYNDELER